MNRMKKMLMLEEGTMPEELVEKVVTTSAMLGFRLLFLDNNENEAIHRVEVRNINFQDLIRHLQRGESVFIIPKLLENSSKHAKKQAPWYFAHT